MKPLYRPLKPFHINQAFGENKICVDLATNKVCINCDGNNPPVGYKSLYGKQGHGGVDLMSYHGQPVYSSSVGVVDGIDTDPRTGLDVKVVFEYEGKKYRITYEHLLGYQVKKGDKVSVGSLIGWADNTGWSSGDHLHWQLQVWDKGWVMIDPLPFTNPVFALDAAPLLKKLKELLAQLSDLFADKLRK